MALPAFLFLVFVGLAQAEAACRVPVDEERVDRFIDDPQRMLLEDPRGGANTKWLVRSMAVVNVRALRAIRTSVPKANRQQKVAIGEGLAQAVGACDARDGGIARGITDAIRTIGDTEVTRAFLRFYAPAEAGTPATLPAQDVPDLRRLDLDRDLMLREDSTLQ